MKALIKNRSATQLEKIQIGSFNSEAGFNKGEQRVFEINFIDACLHGAVDINDIDDYVEYWHNNHMEITLREFLGMTVTEYEEFLKHDNSIIEEILRCRIDSIP